MECPNCRAGIMPLSTRCDNCGYDLVKKKGGTFKASDYWSFQAGVFIVGGIIALPLTYGLIVHLRYFAALPWSLASCAFFFVALRRDGTVSIAIAFLMLMILGVAVRVYNQISGKPAFAAGGILGILLLWGCGYVGIGIKRLFGIGKE
jgi:uncharacterized protein (DUF983 family)